MNEDIKGIFRKHFDQLREYVKNTENQTRRNTYSYAMEEIIDLYSEICGTSYDEAANELHQSTDEGKEKSRR